MLEKNYQDCCDPFLFGYESIFRKNFYELPDEYVNPTQMIATSTKRRSSGLSGSESKEGSVSPSKSLEKTKRNRIPSMARRSSRQVIDKSINDLQNENNKRSLKGSRRGSNFDSDAPVNAELPKTISG